MMLRTLAAIAPAPRVVSIRAVALNKSPRDRPSSLRIEGRVSLR